MPLGVCAETGGASNAITAAALKAASVRIAGLSRCLVLLHGFLPMFDEQLLSIFEDDGIKRKCHFRNSDAPCCRSKPDSRPLWRRNASSSILRRGYSQTKTIWDRPRPMAATMNGRKAYAVRVFDCDRHHPSSSAPARGAAGRDMGRELGRVRARPLPGRQSVGAAGPAVRLSLCANRGERPDV